MMHIHDKEVNKRAECNLLNNIINPTIYNKNLNIHYSPILYECINTMHGKEKFNNFRIILNSVCSSTIVMGRLVEKLNPEKDAVMHRHTPVVNSTTNIEVEVDFNLPALSVTNIMMWKCHVEDSVKSRYDMILGQDILTELELNLKLSEHVIEADDGPLK